MEINKNHINYIQSIPAYQYYSVVNYLILMPIGCQVTMPNMIPCSGGFMAYYKNNSYFL
jgi:hypothetical protein